MMISGYGVWSALGVLSAIDVKRSDKTGVKMPGDDRILIRCSASRDLVTGLYQGRTVSLPVVVPVVPEIRGRRSTSSHKTRPSSTVGNTPSSDAMSAPLILGKKIPPLLPQKKCRRRWPAASFSKYHFVRLVVAAGRGRR